MANTAKIVFLGAGSMSFGLAMFKDLFSARGELGGSALVLVDRDATSLERMYTLAKAMNDRSGAGLLISRTVDRTGAFRGADFVVSSIAIERNRLWRHDFEVPRKHGVRHTLGENGGPGGLFFTLRTIPVLLEIARDMETLCPNAYFLNFSNPESRIVLALGRYTRIRSLGLCHGIFMGQESVAKILGRRPQAIDVMGAGLNHYQWLLQIRDMESGVDLYPELRQKEKDFDPEFQPLSRRLFRAFGFFPSCSDDHIGEYLPYGWEAGEEGYDFAADEKGRIEMRAEIARRVEHPQLLDDWLVPPGKGPCASSSAYFITDASWWNRGSSTTGAASRICPPTARSKSPSSSMGAASTPCSSGICPRLSRGS